MALFTKEEALKCHSMKRRGKLEVVSIKPSRNRKDLSMAYSPGVAGIALDLEQYKKDQEARMAASKARTGLVVDSFGYDL